MLWYDYGFNPTASFLLNNRCNYLTESSAFNQEIYIRFIGFVLLEFSGKCESTGIDSNDG